MVVENWRIHYNTKRPQSALAYRRSAPCTIALLMQQLDATSNMH